MRRTLVFFSAFLFFLLMSARLMTVDAADELKSVSEQPSQIDAEDESAVVQDRYSVPRKQVLLELFGRPT
jgi:hypothetical protein